VKNPSLALTPQDQQDVHDLLRALEVKNIPTMRNWEWAYLPEVSDVPATTGAASVALSD
jgi:hypothetical protein